MHNRDEEHHRITANDFFTYELIRRSRLYKLVETEFITLWEESEETLVWSKFKQITDDFIHKDLRESEKIELMKSACSLIDHSGGSTA